jgi:hypothetical protein
MPYEQSPEQRAINWAKIIETALTAPGTVGNVYNCFYSYSFLNQMYLRMQYSYNLFSDTFVMVGPRTGLRT